MSRYYNSYNIITYRDSEGFLVNLSACFSCKYMRAQAYGMTECKRKTCKYSAEEITCLMDEHKEETHGLD